MQAASLVAVLGTWTAAAPRAGASADTLAPETRAAFDAYLATVVPRFEREAATAPLAWGLSAPGRARALARGDVVAAAGEGDGIFEVPAGLIHHWMSAVFLPGVPIETVLASQRNYEAYPRIYEPIARAELLARDGNVDRVRFRLDQPSRFVHAILESWWSRRFERPAADRAYTVATSEAIQQVVDAGTANERLLPEGEGGGYLWMGATLLVLLERDGGTYVELQTIGLSRRFPRFLGWLIEPIARGIGRGSAERTLEELREELVGSGASGRVAG